MYLRRIWHVFMEVLNAANDVLEILRIFTKQISDSRFNRTEI